MILSYHLAKIGLLLAITGIEKCQEAYNLTLHVLYLTSDTFVSPENKRSLVFAVTGGREA